MSSHPDEDAFTGFVFKIQANMDPKHRDRIAFLRICSGQYRTGMRMRHVRIGKDIKVSDAVTFMAGDRVHAEEAFPGDIIGLHNHGSVQIGDTFTEGESLRFTGVPNFAPELFRRVRVRDPLKTKQLEKGLEQLSEEGATQVFKPLARNEMIVGAVGALQFDLVAFRLNDEYKADCLYDDANVYTVRWVYADDEAKLDEFRRKHADNLAIDGGGYLAYLAPIPRESGADRRALARSALRGHPGALINLRREHRQCDARASDKCDQVRDTDATMMSPTAVDGREAVAKSAAQRSIRSSLT